MATTQTTANVEHQNKVFYERTLLKRALPNLVFYKHGQKKPMPKHEGDTVNFRKFNSLEPATTPLTEGVTPAGKSLKVSSLTATVKQYGDYIETSDKISTTGIDPVVTESTELLGEQAGLTIDTIIRDELCVGSTVQFAGGKLSTEAITEADVLTSTEIKKAARNLKKNNIAPFEGKYYLCAIDAEQSYDLQNDPLWQDISKYSGGTAIMDGEIGKIGKVRFIETENLKIKEGAGANGIDIHCALIFGKDAYGVVDVDGKSKPEIIVKPLGSSGSSDPLNQRATVGWKALFTAVRLNELAMCRLETAVSE